MDSQKLIVVNAPSQPWEERFNEPTGKVLFRKELFTDPETGMEVRLVRYPAGFVNGNLATGLFASSWFVRLPEADAAGMETLTPMADRPMRGYYIVPPATVADDDALTPWVRKAIGHTRTLPPK